MEHNLYRKLGVEDGRRIASSYSEQDKKFIERVLDDSGPYGRWSKFERIEEIKKHLEEIRGLNVAFLYPRFIKIIDGEEVPLHKWVTQARETGVPDRLAEVAWSYTAGCIQGVYEIALESNQ